MDLEKCGTAMKVCKIDFFNDFEYLREEIVLSLRKKNLSKHKTSFRLQGISIRQHFHLVFTTFVIY